MKYYIYVLIAITVWHVLAHLADTYTTISGDQFFVYTLVGVVSALLVHDGTYE